jgi:hypothetical protein
MFKWIREWIRQKALEKIIDKQHLCDMFLYDYQDGAYELLVEGPASDRMEAHIHSFIDEMLTGNSRYKCQILIYRTYEGGGVIMAMHPDKTHFEKFFLKGTYNTDDAFMAIVAWCRKAGPYGPNN